MNLIKWLKLVWENRLPIMQGVVNIFFTNEKTKRMAQKRLSRCALCKYNSANALTSDYVLPFKHCTKCGCSLALKPYVKDAKCPVGIWEK